MAESRRILIATKFRFIGDTLLAIPIFRAARRRWPDAHIALLTGQHARVLLQNNPYLDDIVEFNPTGKDRGLPAFFRVIDGLRRSRFDACVILNRSFHSALIPWLAGIPVRAGWDTEGRGWLLNRRVAYDADRSEIACYYDVLRSIAPDIEADPALELWINDAEASEACGRLAVPNPAHLGSPSGIVVGIQPGASMDIKRWPPERFAAVADALVDADPRVRIVLIGSPDEAAVADAMTAAFAPETIARSCSFVGACNLRQSLALVSQLDLFVGNDTAIMHSAVALGVPTTAIFGPTNPRKWGNYGDGHRVLESTDKTMASVEVFTVIEAVLSLLASVGCVATCDSLPARLTAPY